MKRSTNGFSIFSNPLACFYINLLVLRILLIRWRLEVEKISEPRNVVSRNRLVITITESFVENLSLHRLLLNLTVRCNERSYFPKQSQHALPVSWLTLVVEHFINFNENFSKNKFKVPSRKEILVGGKCSILQLTTYILNFQGGIDICMK